MQAQTSKLEKLLQRGLAVEEGSNTLLSFLGTDVNGRFQLEWRSARDTASGCFAVLAGDDLESLWVAGVIMAKAISTPHTVQYTWLDESVNNSNRIYRLLRIRNKGTYYLSQFVFRGVDLAQ